MIVNGRLDKKAILRVLLTAMAFTLFLTAQPIAFSYAGEALNPPVLPPAGAPTESAPIPGEDIPDTDEGYVYPDPALMTPLLVTDPYIKPTYDRMLADIGLLKAQYPGLVRSRVIGKTASGLDIPMVMLGTGEVQVLIIGSMHAREFVTTSQIMRSIDTYAYAFATGQYIGGVDVSGVLLDEVTYCFVPMVNPDGVAIAQGLANKKQKALAVKAVGAKTYKKYYKLWKGNANAVNLNRNFPVKWKDQESWTKKPSYDAYRGPKGGSEPETKALMRLCEEEDFAFMISAHTRGALVFWQDSYSGSIDGAYELASAISRITKYPRTYTGSRYNGGRFEKWFRYNFERPGIVIEFTSYLQDYHKANKNFDKAIWNRTSALWLKLHYYALY